MNFNQRILYTFIVGLCCGITGMIIYVGLSGEIPFLRAAGLNTGAADVNARYLDGYGTATTTSSNKIYVSDASGYLPDGSVDNACLVSGIAKSKIDSSTNWTLNATTTSATCSDSGCTATATCPSGYTVVYGMYANTVTNSNLCATNPAACNTYCAVGGTNCSATENNSSNVVGILISCIRVY